MIDDESTTDTNLGVLRGCDCPECSVGGDRWCCRKCHELARSAHSVNLKFKCPRCWAVAEWTDGVEAGGNAPAEFWCQACGAESPLLLCQVVDVP